MISPTIDNMSSSIVSIFHILYSWEIQILCRMKYDEIGVILMWGEKKPLIMRGRILK